MTSLEEIIDTVWITDPGPRGWSPKTQIIPLQLLREWMKTEDIEVLGHLCLLVNDARFRVGPPLPSQELMDFLFKYYGRCLRENPQGEWSDTRYSAGWDVVRWFIQLWDDVNTPRTVLLEIKDWLKGLYERGDAELRKCIITATLEHLFERKPIREFFADWRDDATMKQAYDEGVVWAARGGTSPLTRPTRKLPPR